MRRIKKITVASLAIVTGSLAQIFEPGGPRWSYGARKLKFARDDASTFLNCCRSYALFTRGQLGC